MSIGVEKLIAVRALGFTGEMHFDKSYNVYESQILHIFKI